MITADSSAAVTGDAPQIQALDLYKALFTQSPQPFALHSVTTSAAGKPLDCVCVDANAAFQTVLAVPKDRLIGGRIHELSPQMPKASLFPVIEDVLFDHEPDHLTVLSPSNSRYYDVAVMLVAPGTIATVLSELIGIRGAEPAPRNGATSETAVGKAAHSIGQDQPPAPRGDRDGRSGDLPAGYRPWTVAADAPPLAGPGGKQAAPTQAHRQHSEMPSSGVAARRPGSPALAPMSEPISGQPRSDSSTRGLPGLPVATRPVNASTLGGTHTYLAGERRSAAAGAGLPAASPSSGFDESLGEVHQALMAAAIETYSPESATPTTAADAGNVTSAAGAICVDEADFTEDLPLDGNLWTLLLRTSDEGIWIWDLRTSQVLFSSRWRQMLGYATSDVRDQFGQYARLVHADDLPAMLQAIQSYVNRQSPVYESEHRLRCKDGGYRWVRSRGAAIWDETGAASRMVVFQADIHDRKMADLRLQRSQLLSASLRSVRHAAGHVPGKDNLLQVACTTLVERGLVQRAWIGEFDEVTGVVTPVARDGVDSVDLGTVRVPKAGDPFRNGPTAVAIASKESHVVNDVRQLEVRFPWAQQAAQIGYAAAASFPIIVGERSFGALTVYADQPGFFSVDEVMLFEEISSVLGFAVFGIEQKELRSKAESELQHVSYHDQLTGLYNRPYFEEEVRRLQGSRLYPITIISTDLDGLKVVNDVMGNRAGDQLLSAYANVLKASFRTSDVVARVGGDEFSIILPATDSEAAQGLVTRLLERMNAHNLEGRTLPLSHSLGVATASEPFDSLEILCRQADNAMFIDRNRRAPTRGRNLVRVLMTALGKKDFGADGHVARVKALSTTLGEAVGLTGKDMAELELLSEIHDLGKIGVPDRVLFKPGPLDNEEREQIKQHSALGFRIAKISPELEHVAELILYHQEWWNGAGYPTGIGGEEIPVACRVLAIADAFDAMTSSRPHRPALSHADALQELRRGAGRQFDPAIVEKFLQITEGS